jgi:hypothetical protein
MGLGDITGVFSRYLVVGFFLPAYIALVALWLAASEELVPAALEGHSEGTQLLILGAVALVAGLVLSGSSYLITRVFEGYPLLHLRRWPLLSAIPRAAIWAQRRSYRRLVAVRDDESRPNGERGRAAWCLDRYFPADPDQLLPTRMGNAIRAFERHSNVRWGVDGITIWPRVEALLTKEERELHVDAKIDLYVFMNGSVGAFVAGVCLLVDQAVNQPQPPAFWPLYAIPFVVGYALYRLALTPAVNWGEPVRASIDLHRLEVYEKLGVRAPTSFSDERELGRRVSQALLYGRPLLDDDLWRKSGEGGGEEGKGEREGFLAEYLDVLRKMGGKP